MSAGPSDAAGDAAGGIAAIASIEQLLADAEQLADPRARALARSLAAALVDLVGAGLGRVLELGTPELARALADDELVGNLLVLAGRHPDAAAVRAERALAAAGAELGSLGVKLDGVSATAAGVRVRVSAAHERGGSADADRVRQMVEAIVVARAPDADAIVVELGGHDVMPAGFVSAARLRVVT